MQHQCVALDFPTISQAHTGVESNAIAAQVLGVTGRPIYEIINESSDPNQLDEMGRLLWQSWGDGSIPPSLSLPPLECCFGTSPIQAEKLRPDRKAFGSATLPTRAVASTGPTPGIASSRLLVSFDRCQAMICRSKPRI